MQLINTIFTQNSTQASTSSQTSTQSDNIDTLENLIQALEEVAKCLSAFPQSQTQSS